ncbi:MAG: S-layer homology domain-containing protein [Clostridia bacterium]|nr:S-layer homology domain-containing protein [Clostridia bacterium]
MKKIIIVTLALLFMIILTALFVNADMSEFINITSNPAGEYDIYKVPQTVSSGYRYGPSFIVNDDGTIDAWFASSGSSTEQWDWIMYKHFDGKNWSEEKCVLQPTPMSLDRYSCCDPGVIYINGYYYLAYTSTINYAQTDNSLFVARSKKPDGPYEKWNGDGWGGFSPKPIVCFTEDQSFWGIGEPSLTEVNGTLYLYYTESGTKGHCTALATADANNENWPLTLCFRGYALKNTTCDAIDVKYSEEYKKFIAVASEKRLTDQSYLVFFESNDGLRFRITDICKKNVYAYCHNPGLSGDKRGHITKDTSAFVSYAYGKEWGVWNTTVLPIEISASSYADLKELYSKNRTYESLPRDTRESSTLDITGISAQTKCMIRRSSHDEKVKISMYYCTAFRDKWRSISGFADEIKMYGYNESIIKRINNSMEFQILSAGETMITVEFRGHLTYIYVYIYDIATITDTAEFIPVTGTDFNITVNSKDYIPQIKSIISYCDGTNEYVFGTNRDTVTYEYDSFGLSIDEEGHITAKKTGIYTVKVSYEDLNYLIKVSANEGRLVYKGFPDVKSSSWYYNGVKYCYENKYINGNDKGMFAPEGELTREQFVVMLARMDKADLSYYKDSPFNDTNSESWYGPAVIWAENGGYIQGVGNGNFGVGRTITREEIAVLMFRYSLDTNLYPQVVYSYKDWNNISSWAIEGINWSLLKGIIGSTHTNELILSPKLTVTRAQAVKIFMSFDTLK